MELHEVLRDVLTRSGVSQAEAARRAGVHVTTLEKILSGQSYPRSDVLARLLGACGVKWKELERWVVPQSTP